MKEPDLRSIRPWKAATGLIRWVSLWLALCAGCSSVSTGSKPLDAAGLSHPDAVLNAEAILSRSNEMGQAVNVADDLVYGVPKKYKAISLASLLHQMGFGTTPDAVTGEVVVTCSDGYKAVMSSAEALDGAGFLAFSDESGAGGGMTPVKTSSGLVDPGPLYLVWTNRSETRRPWPYQIQRLEVYSSGRTLRLAEPSGSALAERGFELFRQNCSACHAVNGAGGKVAIDLNVPMNVTEYWRDSILRRLIVNAASIRANAKMPAFPQFTKPDVDAILAYLREMRTRKVVDR